VNLGNDALTQTNKYMKKHNFNAKEAPYNKPSNKELNKEGSKDKLVEGNK